MSGFSVFLPDSDEQGYPDADMQCEELHDLPPEVEQEFQDIRSVGSGTFSTVYGVVHRRTKLGFALKEIQKEYVSQKQRLLDEVSILHRLRHPNIITLHHVIDTPDRLYLVMDLALGGELFDKVVEKGHYSEQDAIVIMRKLLGALHYLHSQGVVHRDLKPENILLKTRQDDTEIALSDFGLAKLFDEDHAKEDAASPLSASVGSFPSSFPSRRRAFTVCGSDYYIAPEVLEGRGYNFSVDMWAAGVILYILLCGFPPFFANSEYEIYELVRRGAFRFRSPFWDTISDGAKDLVSALLVVEPTQRARASTALNHPWLKALGASPSPLPGGNLERLRQFQMDSKRSRNSSGRSSAIPSL